MPASYPSSVKSFSTITDNVTEIVALHNNERADEITAIQTELGADVAHFDTDLKTRLDNGLPKAFAHVDQTGTQTLVKNENISGIADNGAGLTTLTIDNDLPDTNICMGGSGDTSEVVGIVDGTEAVGSVQIQSTAIGGSAADSNSMNAALFAS